MNLGGLSALAGFAGAANPATAPLSGVAGLASGIGGAIGGGKSSAQAGDTTSGAGARTNTATFGNLSFGPQAKAEGVQTTASAAPADNSTLYIVGAFVFIVAVVLLRK